MAQCDQLIDGVCVFKTSSIKNAKVSKVKFVHYIMLFELSSAYCIQILLQGGFQREHSRPFNVNFLFSPTKGNGQC